MPRRKRGAAQSSQHLGDAEHRDSTSPPKHTHPSPKSKEQKPQCESANPPDPGASELSSDVTKAARTVPEGWDIVRLALPTMSLDDLNKTIGGFVLLTAFLPDDDPSKLEMRNAIEEVAKVLSSRMEEFPEESLAYQCQCIDLIPDTDPSKLEFLNGLALPFDKEFQRLGEVFNLEAAILYMRHAVDLAPDNHPEKHKLLNNLGAFLMGLFERLGDLSNLEEAISVCRQSVNLTPDDHPGRPGHLVNLGSFLMSRFRRLGKLVDIEAAISFLRQAAVLISDDHPDKVSCLNSLGISLMSRFERLSELADIEESISLQKRVLALTPDDHPDIPMYLNNLGISLMRRFESLGYLSDLEVAISSNRKGVSLIPDDHPNKPMYMNNLGASLEARFDHLGELADLEAAISILRQTTAFTPDDSADKPMFLNNFGILLERLFTHRRDVADLEESILALRQAVSLTPDSHSYKPTYLGNLGNSLMDQFSHLGELAALDEAISSQHQALALCPDDHSETPIYLGRLGSCHESRFRHLKKLTDLEAAVSFQRQAVALTPDNHPLKLSYLNDLGRLLVKSSFKLGKPDDFYAGVSCAAQVATSPTGPPTHRLTGARSWTNMVGYGLHCQSCCLEAHATVMQLLPQAAWLGSNIRRRYEILAKFGKTTNAAVAVAISQGEFDLALEWLEAGRSIVWGQSLQLRTSVDDLREVAPAIADELESVSAQISQFATPSGRGVKSVGNVNAMSLNEDQTQKYSRLTLRYEELLKQVRELPGFEDFLRPKRLSTFRQAARSGPIIFINVDASRCDALILPNPSDPVIHIPLPKLTLGYSNEMYGLLNSLRRGVVRGVVIASARPSLKRMGGILENIWGRIVQPILQVLKSKHILSVSTDGELPRVTWCGTGPVAFLPLHAAGNYRRGSSSNERIFNHVVSSYTPSIGALLASQQQTSPNHRGPRLLAISQPATPQTANEVLSALPGTLHEISQVRGRVGKQKMTWLNDDEATRDEVLQAMTTHRWTHFACHATQKADDPLKSAFHLYDGPLELEEIMKKSVKHAELAVLFACSTAKGDNTLPEEATHLTAGMMMAGYRSVVGTMWSIQDQDAPVVAEEFYKYLMKEGCSDSKNSAYALHHAVKVLRNEIGDASFGRWIPFIHFGA